MLIHLFKPTQAKNIGPCPRKTAYLMQGGEEGKMIAEKGKEETRVKSSREVGNRRGKDNKLECL